MATIATPTAMRLDAKGPALRGETIPEGATAMRIATTPTRDRGRDAAGAATAGVSLLSGVMENGVMENGVTENGVTENGVTENGVTENGVTENSVTENSASGAPASAAAVACASSPNAMTEDEASENIVNGDRANTPSVADAEATPTATCGTKRRAPVVMARVTAARVAVAKDFAARDSAARVTENNGPSTGTSAASVRPIEVSAENGPAIAMDWPGLAITVTTTIVIITTTALAVTDAEAAGMAGRGSKVMLTGITADMRDLAGPGTADFTADSTAGIAITAAAGLLTNLLIADEVTTNGVSGAGSDGLTIGATHTVVTHTVTADLEGTASAGTDLAGTPLHIIPDTASTMALPIAGLATIGVSARRSTGDIGTAWRWRVGTGSEIAR